MNCQVCHSDNVGFAFELMVSGKLWRIYECGDCQTQFVHPVPSSRVLERFYRASNLQAKVLNNPRYGWLSFWRQRRMIEGLVGDMRGRILDFGCGGGQFLSHFGNGWERFGCDISEEARYISSRKGIETIATIGDDIFPNGFFDVVAMFAVIEHLPKPREIVGRLCGFLKVGGLFAVMTGDVASLKARMRGRRWHMYSPPAHLWFFSAQSLDLLMASFGLEKIKGVWSDGGMARVPFLETVPVLRDLPVFDHYYGYYRKTGKAGNV